MNDYLEYNGSIEIDGVIHPILIAFETREDGALRVALMDLNTAEDLFLGICEDHYPNPELPLPDPY